MILVSPPLVVFFELIQVGVMFRIHLSRSKRVCRISWVCPPPSNSDYQDYYMFSRDPHKPSFATAAGSGPHPKNTLRDGSVRWLNHPARKKNALNWIISPNTVNRDENRT